MQKNILSLAVATASLLSFSKAYAVLDIEIDLITTATKQEQTLAQNLAPVIVIDRSQIEQSSATDISDLLRFYAGIDIAKNGGDGTPISLFIRGTNSAHVLVLVDGIKINSASTGGAALQYLTPDMIERIELVKGPRSSLYGSEAIGGVLNITTRRNISGLSLYAGSGSLATFKTGFNAGFQGDDVDASVSFSQFKTDGYEDNVNSNEKHAFENQSFQLRLGTQLANTRLDITHSQANGEGEYYGFNTDTFAFSELTQDNTNITTSIIAKTGVNKAWTSHITLGQAHDENNQTVTADYFHTQRDFFEWQNNLTIADEHLLTVGLSTQKEAVTSNKYNESIDVDSLYFQNDFIRGQHHIIVALRALEHSSFGGHSTYNIDYGFKLSQALQFGFSLGTAFKAPSLNELYFPFYGNIDLKPEESKNKEVSLRFQIDPKQSIKLAIFDNSIEHLIAYDSNTFSAGNVSKANIEGIELDYQWTQNIWSLYVTYINQNPIDQNTGDVLSRRAEETLTAAVAYKANGVTSSVNILSTSKRYDGTNDLDAYLLVNAQAAFQYTKNIGFSINIENVFDEEYETAFGYPAKSRGVFLQMTYQQK